MNSSYEELLNPYFNKISSSRFKALTAEQEFALYQRIQKGDKKAEHELATANLRFVVSVAKNYQNQGIAFEDLVSIGNMGLLQAVKKFDARKNFKFISYAVWWIRQAILQAISQQSRITSVPLNQTTRIRKVRETVELLTQKNHHRPSSEEIASEMNLSVREVEETLRMDFAPISMDQPIRDNSTGTLSEIIKGEDDFENAILSTSSWKLINEALDHLPKREKEVILRYFGFDGYPPSTLEEIGVYMGMTRERVRQLKERALETLKTNKKVLKSLRSLLSA